MNAVSYLDAYISNETDDTGISDEVNGGHIKQVYALSEKSGEINKLGSNHDAESVKSNRSIEASATTLMKQQLFRQISLIRVPPTMDVAYRTNNSEIISFSSGVEWIIHSGD